MFIAVLSLRKWTEPSQNTALAPPEWKLESPNEPPESWVPDGCPHAAGDLRVGRHADAALGVARQAERPGFPLVNVDRASDYIQGPALGEPGDEGVPGVRQGKVHGRRVAGDAGRIRTLPDDVLGDRHPARQAAADPPFAKGDGVAGAVADIAAAEGPPANGNRPLGGPPVWVAANSKVDPIEAK